MDCDPGLDDALAILLALGLQDIVDVKAIVATFGNVGLSQTRNNLLRILGLFDPVAAVVGRTPLIGSGSEGPLRHNEAREARDVHGEDGLGGVSYSFKKRHKADFKNGIELIIELVLSKKIDKIITTGPLTDLARAITKKPKILEYLKELVIMGGAVFVKGNVTPYAEFNFYCDPEAARIVLSAPVKKRLVSLDVTQRTLLRPQHLKPLRDINGPLAKFICRIADYSIHSNKRRGIAEVSRNNGYEGSDEGEVSVKYRNFSNGAPMHDPLAVALAIDEGMGEYENLCLDVGIKGKTSGKVVVKEGRANTLFCKAVNVDRFFKLFIGALIRLAKGRR